MSVEINAQAVASLRSRTGVGFMDCKKALVEANGNEEEAITILKKKGIATASKLAGRNASEGIIEAYIHGAGKIGVLIEINCETDFVAKNDDFKQLAKNLAIHVAASNPTYAKRADVPEVIIEKEREIATAQCEGKPAEAIKKIIDGKLEKYYQQNCILEQPFVKNPDQTVQDLINEKIAQMGENIVIGKFARYQIGG